MEVGEGWEWDGMEMMMMMMIWALGRRNKEVIRDGMEVGGGMGMGWYGGRRRDGNGMVWR